MKIFWCLQEVVMSKAKSMAITSSVYLFGSHFISLIFFTDRNKK